MGGQENAVRGTVRPCPFFLSLTEEQCSRFFFRVTQNVFSMFGLKKESVHRKQQYHLHAFA